MKYRSFPRIERNLFTDMYAQSTVIVIPNRKTAAATVAVLPGVRIVDNAGSCWAMR